jgi:AcrR family transcriptional regulator
MKGMNRLTIQKRSGLPRKTPMQQRSMQTMETLLDTATQILHTDGEVGFTTNRVAERAGFSIGTLYQYFPDKTAIVAALAERERATIERALTVAIDRADPSNLEQVIRVVIRTAIGAFGRRRHLRKFVILQMLRMNLAIGMMNSIDQIGLTVVRAIQARAGDKVRPLSDVAVFVLTRAIMGGIRGAVLLDGPMLETQELEDELVRMAMGFVGR